MRPSYTKIRCVLLLISLAILSACREPQVASYRTAKEKSPDVSAALANSTNAATDKSATALPAAASVPSDANMAGAVVATATGAGLTWTAPAHWVAKPASAMRKATFTLSGNDGTTAELAVTAFPGDVGGELANLNRWRGQLSLPPLAQSDIPGVITRYEYNALHFAVVDFVATSANPPSRMLGAMVPVGGATWFFKLTGPDTLVATEKPAFLMFLQTVKVP